MTDKVVMKGVKMLYSSISFDQQDVQSLKRECKKQPVQGIKPAENINFQSRNINRMGILAVGGLAANIRDKRTSCEENG